MRPLLPGSWFQVNWQEGIQEIRSSQFVDNFYEIDKIKHSGIPSIFAIPFAFTMSLEANNKKSIKRFNLMIQGIFLEVIRVKNHQFPQTDNKLTKVIKQFSPYVDHNGLDEFYTLHWQDKTIGGIFNDCLVYPGAKFQIASEWDRADQRSPEPDYIDGAGLDITFASLEETINKQIHLFGEDLTKALYGLWVDEIQKVLVAGGVKLPTVGWFNRLLDIKNTAWQTSLQPNNPRIISKYTNEQKIKLEVNNVILNIPICSLDKQKNMFVDKLVQFGANKYPDYPVKSDFLGQIADCGVGLKQQVPEYTIKLNEWNDSFIWSPLKENLVQILAASLLVWPDFKAEGWNVNYVYLTANNGMEVNFLKDRNGKPGKILGTGNGSQLDYTVEYVEVMLNNTQLGILSDHREDLKVAKNQNTISIDFGTTNTSVGYTNPANGQIDIMPFRNLSVDLFKTDYWWHNNNEQKRKESRFLPTAFSNDAMTSLPSELLFATPQDKQLGDESLQMPIDKYTNSHPFFTRKATTDVSSILLDDFKWKTPSGFQEEIVITAYFRLILHLALAQIRRDMLCVDIDIIPTYPLAFGEGKYAFFKNLLVNLFNVVSGETGIVLDLAIVNAMDGTQELVSETMAAKAYRARAPEIERAELVVDLGGGTTDIAMWVKTGDKLHEVVESIKYGGNAYLNRLATKFLPRNIDNPGDQRIALQKIIRESKDGINVALHQYGETRRNVAETGINQFFEGLFYYLYRLFAKYNIEKVNFYPVGNGWRLIDGLSNPRYTIDSYIEEIFAFQNIEAQVTLPGSIDDYKGAVCKGAKFIGNLQDYKHPENIEVKTIVGGTIKVNSNGLNWDEQIPTKALGGGTLAIDTTKYIEEFLQFSSLNVSEQKRAQYVNRLNRQMGSVACLNFANGQKGLNKSVISVFLETIYPEMIM